jgi:hypothetical protein
MDRLGSHLSVNDEQSHLNSCMPTIMVSPRAVVSSGRKDKGNGRAMPVLCEVCGFRSGDYEACHHPGSYTVWLL